MFEKGIWIDENPYRFIGDGYAKQLSNMGFDHIFYVVIGSNGKLLFDPELLGRVRDDCYEHNIDVGLSMWPTLTNTDLIEEVIGETKEIAFIYEMDIESQYKNHQSSKWEPIVERIQQKIYDSKRTMRITTLPFPHKITSLNPWIRYCDEVNIQAYSIRNRGNAEVSHNSRYGPGNYQKYAIDVFYKNSCRKHLTIGLPAWSQSFKIGAVGSMKKSLNQCESDHRVKGITYWSSKWVIGIRKTWYSSNIIRTLNGTSSRSKSL